MNYVAVAEYHVAWADIYAYVSPGYIYLSYIALYISSNGEKSTIKSFPLS